MIKMHMDTVIFRGDKYHELRVEYGYLPYVPAKMPSPRNDTGDPSEGPEVEVTSVYLIPTSGFKTARQSRWKEVYRLLTPYEMDKLIDQCHAHGEENWRDYADRGY